MARRVIAAGAVAADAGGTVAGGVPARVLRKIEAN